MFGMTAPYEPQPSLSLFTSRNFLTTGFLWGGAVNPTTNPQPGGKGLLICNPWRQGDPAIPPGTRYPF
jgi:hypothetical protein